MAAKTEKLKLHGDPTEYAWSQCVFCKNTIKFCGLNWTVCPACGSEYEVLPNRQEAAPVALPGFYPEEE